MPKTTRLLLPILALCFASTALGGDFNPGPQGTYVPSCIVLSTGDRFFQNPIGEYTVHVESAIGVVPGAQVIVQFAEAADIALAPGESLTNELTTNLYGDATFEFQGSGCYTQECLGFPPATVSIYEDGELTLQQDIPVVISPSPVDAGGLTHCQGGNKCDEINGQSIGVVSTADAVWGTPAIKLGLVEPCMNFTPPYDFPVALDDAVYWSAYVKAGRSCGCTP